MAGSLEIIPIRGLPLIRPGDRLADLILRTVKRRRVTIKSGDVFVIGQKAVSKSEGQLVDISQFRPSARAIELGKRTGKNPGFVELVLRDTSKVVRADKTALIVRTKHGWTCLNAGVDKSNVKGPYNFAMLPENPDASARKIRKRIRELTGQ